MNQQCEEQVWSQVVARAWCDEGFMSQLRSDPRAVLAEHGLEVPEDTDVEVLEGDEVQVLKNTNSKYHFILTASPPDGLSEEELVGDGVAWYCAACGRCGACGCRCACRCRCV
jgi:hypothetical protein